MAQIGISIEKDTMFRGKLQPFQNVYHYRSADPGNPAAVEAQALVDEIVVIEKTLHSTVVNFRTFKVWSSGGDALQNSMILQGNLTGTGGQATAASFDRERAILFQWPAGLSVTGKPVFLRKWFHSCGAVAGQFFADGVLGNTDQITTSHRSAIATEANKLRLIGTLDGWLLIAQSGREHTGPGSCHPYLEHHQLGDQWR